MGYSYIRGIKGVEALELLIKAVARAFCLQRILQGLFNNLKNSNNIMKKIIFLSLLCMTAVQMYSQTMKATIIMRDSIVYTGEIVNMNSKGVTCIIDGSQTSFVAEELGDVYLENGQVKHYNPILGKRNKPKETSETTKRLLPAPIIATIIMRDSAVIVGELVQMSDIDVDCIIDGAKTKFSAEELSEVRLDNGSIKHYNDIIRKQEEPIISVAEQFDSVDSNVKFMEDKVIKTDGSIITGKVISITDNEVNVHKLSNNVTYVIKKREIHEIVYASGEVEEIDNIKPQHMANGVAKKGYHGTASISGGGYISSDMWLGGGLLSLHTTHGYQLNPYVFVGGGVGLDFAIAANNWGKVGVLMPLFADAKFGLPVNNAFPFIELKFGYAVPLSKPDDRSTYEGLYFSPSVGALFNITEKYSVGAALEYSLTHGQRNLKPQVWNFLSMRLIFGF